MRHTLPFRLLAITPPTGPVDPNILTAWQAADATTCGLAVLLREPGSPPDPLLHPNHRLTPLRRACQAQGIPVLLSAAADTLPQAVAAVHTHALAGLQLRGDPSADTLTSARIQLLNKKARPHPLLGRSCHYGAPPAPDLVDYSVFAPVFTPQTPSPGITKTPVGLAALSALTRTDPHVFALGGVTPRTARACLEAGAFGLASIRTFFGPPGEVTDNVRALVDALLRDPSPDHAAPTS